MSTITSVESFAVYVRSHGARGWRLVL